MAYIGKRPQDTFPATNAVTSTLIAENNITAREIATNTIVTSLIADNAVTAVKIAENVISSRELAANTVATGNIADNAVDGTKIAQNSILTRHIDDAQITTGHIIDANVTTVKIADVNVTTAKIADDAITAAKITDNAVGAAALNISGNGTSGQALLSDGDGSFSYGAGGKTTEEVQDIAGAMFTSNTETGITATYEDGDGTIDLVIGTLNQNTTGSAATLTTPRAIAVAGAVTGTVNFDGSAGVSITTTLANNAVLTQHIDDNQVTADQIAAATITTTQIAANTIATGNVADNAIDGTKIASNSILTRHIDDNQVTTDQIAANTIATGNIADNAVDGTKIASNSILTRHIDDDQVTGDQLADTITVVTSVVTPLVDAAIIDGENFKVNGGQGSDGQVLTSTGSGVAWEAAGGGVAGISTSANATAITISSAENSTFSGHIYANANNTYDLGATATRWRNIYTNDLQLSNEGGDANEVDGTNGSWTIQEGEEDLFIINRKSGKQYKFKLEEV